MPIEGYRYRSSSFGPRFDPINRRRAFHEGIDFAAPRGTPIYAAAGGVVLTAKYLRGYGNTVEIDHGDRLVTRYAHASRLLVKPGQVIKRGQQVATVGSTGRSTGPHLHFEVRVDGQAADPRLYLAGAANPLSQALARAD
ncbi:MAG: M23 family metallopeptidase [Pigmentiphaga sp.]|nr:M23 family metallopeptidase [Pigmentiphaga sp.]